MQVRSFRDTLRMVDADLIGIKRRTNNTSNYHPMVRHDWGIEDKIRGSLGRYYTVYESSRGTALVNYAGALRGLREGANPAAGWYDHAGSNNYEARLGGNHRLRGQLNGPNDGTNIVFDYEVIRYDDAHYTPILRLSSSAAAWNAYQSRNAASTDFIGGYNGMGRYVKDGFNLGNTAYAPLLDNSTYYDHTCYLYNLSADKQTRLASGVNLRVEPIYNYYPATTPPYEIVIGSSPQVQEYYLPNVYYLQSELHNTSSALLAQYHLPALTLNERVPWFVISNQQTVTEANIGRYYDMYAEGLQDVLEDTSELQLLDTNLEKNNKNFVVLYSDLGALKEDRIDTTTIPFYNKLILGYDIDLRAGKEEHISILQQLYNDSDTKDFINLLQMATVLKLTTAAAETTQAPFTTTRRTVLSAEDASQWNFKTSTQDYNVLYDLEDLLNNMIANNDAVTLADMINNFSTFNPNVQYNGFDLDSLPFRLIRDYQLSEDQLDSNAVHAENAENDMFSVEGSPSAVSRVLKTFEEVLETTPCHSETLMYIIKKKTAPDAAPIQTFYVAANFRSSTPTMYYDTQVKYNVPYYYEIDRVVLLFGNEYRYVDSTAHVARATATGTADLFFHNSPSIKAVVVPYVSGDIESIILDKPPVPPEISFYPLKGINNKVQILLNSSTGQLESKPVTILPTDSQFFLDEYKSQTGEQDITFNQMVEGEKKIEFRSDDPVDAYQLFKIDNLPASYASFSNGLIYIDPARGVGGYLSDTIEPNKKYYYCARAVDIHNNISNPSHIYEIEMVDNNGQIFLKQKVFTYESAVHQYSKSGRRLIYIEPSLQQKVFTRPDEAGNPGVNNLPTFNILGAQDVDTVWQKSFRVRVTSKKTGRKVDLNLTFKNSGILNPSE